MFRFLKGLFSKKEVEESLTLTVDGAGAWLDARDEEIEAGLEEATGRCRTAVSASLEDLGRLLATLKDAEGREDVHPKLKSVTDRSLPAFIAAMEQQAAHPLPDDADGFYAAAAELLTGLLKAQKGQGRYLAAVFPEEMKEVRGVTRDIGREINTLTGLVKEAQATTARIGAARAGLAAVTEAGTETENLDAEIGALRKRLEAADPAIARDGERLRALTAGQDYAACMTEQERLAGLKKEEEGAVQDLTNTAAQEARVMRKAERVAGRARAQQDLRTLEACTALLDRPLDAGREEILPLVEAAAGVVQRQIPGGELALKGKDDLALFADAGAAEKEMDARIAALDGVRERVAAAEERVRACTALGEARRLEEAIASAEAEKERDRQALASAEARKRALADGEADRLHRLEEALAAVAGRPVTLA
ncbi:MAG: hypothetical protein PHP59_09780 [Methanofollis sp.]|uniref:hypothetical protein n=1 Tax=Methanofollis sp. TaxID=2052835 RepID=UPI0026226715|nr:hypothetical protein [Methanofollis sp.]MDD4255647.1 hypothetical protein [Methanofollis sp.]